MEQYVIKGGNRLNGEIEIGGAKNAALAILAASIMTDETVTIENLPNVRDINVLLQAIEEIGAKVERVDAHKVKINGSFILKIWGTNANLNICLYRLDLALIIEINNPKVFPFPPIPAIRYTNKGKTYNISFPFPNLSMISNIIM